jgi:hypothetical protein
MNLEELVSSLPVQPGSWVKPGPRKSVSQPHTWMLVERKVRYVVKYSAPFQASALQVMNEIAFYQAVANLDEAIAVEAAIPKLIRSGTSNGWPYLIMEGCSGSDPTRWIGRAMQFHNYARVLIWQRAVLDWLLAFQNCGALRKSLRVPMGSCACHNDFSHFNILGKGRQLRVLDWENWSVGDKRYLDAFHLLACPTLLGDTHDQRIHTFISCWSSNNTYKRGALGLLQPFLGTGDWAEGMLDYLKFQEQLLADSAPNLATMYGAALDEWRSQ